MKKLVKKISTIVLMIILIIYEPLLVFAYNKDQNSYDVSKELYNSMNLEDLNTIRQERITIRQPIMEILQRNVKRTAPEILSDTFTLPGTNISYTFNNYPQIGKPVKLTNFEKYMLLRQVWYYNQNAMKFASNGSLKKHPAADGYYGGVEVKDNAVVKRIVTDPIYTSPLTTGLYMPAGEVITVKVKGLKNGQKVSMVTNLQQTVGYRPYGSNMDEYFKGEDAKIIQESTKVNPNYNALDITIQSQYLRQNEEIPCMGSSAFTFTENDKEYKIGSIFGGQLHIVSAPSDEPVEIIITGAVETPHYILGVTTPQYYEEYLRNAPGIMGTLDTENGQLVGYAKAFRNAQDIESVGYFWHSAFTINVSFTGKPYNYNTILKFDHHVPAGAAVALSSHDAAHPSGWLDRCLKYYDLTRYGNWGVFHELGHIHAASYGTNWGLRGNQEGEVWNNTLITLIYTMLGNMKPSAFGLNGDNIEHGEVAHAYSTVKKYLSINNNYTDYNNLDYFESLSLYANLIHYFSPEKFIELLYTYKDNKTLPRGVNGNIRSEFIYRISHLYKYDFRKMLNYKYKVNVNNTMFTEEQLKEMSSYPEFWPIASKIGNGVNNTSTSRKEEFNAYDVTYLNFNIGGNAEIVGGNLLTEKKYEIVGYSKPQYGAIEEESYGKIKYIPPKELVSNDSFEVRVKITNTDNIVNIPIRFNFNYNMTKIEMYKAIVNNRNLLEAIEKSKNINPEVYYTTVAGINEFYTDQNYNDYLKSQFKYIVTESGIHSFYLKGDDAAIVNFKLNNEVINNKLSIAKDLKAYNENVSTKIDLKVGDELIIESHLLNFGGKGYLNIGVKKPNETTITNVSKPNLFHIGYEKTDQNLIDEKEEVKKFLTSLKNIDTAIPLKKTNWEVIAYPEIETDQNINDLIDGNVNTSVHTKWRGTTAKFPHEYIVDMHNIYNIDYIDITRNSRNDAAVKKYELYVSVDGINYDLISSKDTGYSSSQNSRFNFPARDVRYIKYVVKEASRNYTILSEFSAGTSGFIQNAIKPINNNSFINGFDKNSNGSINTSNSGSVYKYSFNASEISIYANTNANYGAAKIFLDGKYHGIIDLNQNYEMNKLVYVIKTNENKNHTIEIITLDDRYFNISFISTNYIDQESIYADYTKLDNIIFTIPSNLEDYDDKKVSELQNTISSINRYLEKNNQDLVDTYVEKIKNLIDNLSLKKADYTKLYELLNKIPKDISNYTKDSINNLNNVLSSIVYDLDITMQNKVNQMITKLENAINNLTLKTKNIVSKNDNKPINNNVIDNENFISENELNKHDENKKDYSLIQAKNEASKNSSYYEQIINITNEDGANININLVIIYILVGFLSLIIVINVLDLISQRQYLKN